MNEKQIIAHMVTELDFYAKEYQNYTDSSTKENIANEFKAYVRSYNALLNSIYRKISHVSFTQMIETYIEQRKAGTWG